MRAQAERGDPILEMRDGPRFRRSILCVQGISGEKGGREIRGWSREGARKGAGLHVAKPACDVS